MSIDPKAIERLNRWRHVGDGPTNYTAGSKQFADDVIVALIEIERLRKAISDAIGQAERGRTGLYIGECLRGVLSPSQRGGQS